MRFTFILVFLLFLGCSDETEQKEYYSNGNLKGLRQMKGGRLHGLSKSYYPNGSTKASECWQNGELHGTTRLFHKNGNVKATVKYENGKAIMPSMKRFYPNGDLESKYLEGAPIQVFYHQNGAIQEKNLYNIEDSLLDYIKFDSNGVMNFLPPNQTSYIDFLDDTLELGEHYSIEVNRSYGQWMEHSLIVTTSYSNIADSDTIIALDDDLGYYKYYFDPKDTGLYKFDLFFYDPTNSDTTRLYSTQLVVVDAP